MIITKDSFRLQRIYNLQRSIMILILDLEAKRKELEEEIKRLRRENG